MYCVNYWNARKRNSNFFSMGSGAILLGSAGEACKEDHALVSGHAGRRSLRANRRVSSGLRTAVGRTKLFKLVPLPPKVEIVRPRAGQVFAAWHPVELQGQVRDRQRGDVPAEECVWTLKRKEIGRGLLVYGGFWAPGSYGGASSIQGGSAVDQVSGGEGRTVICTLELAFSKKCRSRRLWRNRILKVPAATFSSGGLVSQSRRVGSGVWRS